MSQSLCAVRLVAVLPHNVFQQPVSPLLLDQPVLPEDRLHQGAVFHGKADLDPLALQVGHKDPVAPGPVVICRKPGLDVAGAVQAGAKAFVSCWLTEGAGDRRTLSIRLFS